MKLPGTWLAAALSGSALLSYIPNTYSLPLPIPGAEVGSSPGTSYVDSLLSHLMIVLVVTPDPHLFICLG